MLGKSKVMLVSSKEITSKKTGEKFTILSFLPEKGNAVIEIFSIDEVKKVPLVERKNYILEYNLDEKKSEQLQNGRAKIALTMINLTAE